MGFPGGASDKETASQCKSHKRHRFNPSVRKIPQKVPWKPNPVFLPGEPQGQRSLKGYSLYGHKESDMTETAMQCTYAHLNVINKVSIKTAIQL